VGDASFRPTDLGERAVIFARSFSRTAEVSHAVPWLQGWQSVESKRFTVPVVLQRTCCGPVGRVIPSPCSLQFGLHRLGGGTLIDSRNDSGGNSSWF